MLPANWYGEKSEYAEHWTLTTFVLDGHHKIQAAAESGRVVRLVTFISREKSNVGGLDVDAVVDALAALGD